MQERTLNFILALVTGRVWSRSPITSIDIWNYKPGIDFILDNFIPCLFPKEKVKINKKSGFHKPSCNLSNYHFGFYTVLEKKKAGIYHT